MTPDEETTLLELAAKAHGFIDDQRDNSDAIGLHRCVRGSFYVTSKIGWRDWRPLHNDTDALNLATRLYLVVACMRAHMNRVDGREPFTAVYHFNGREHVCENHGSDPHAATRLAIVRCAAAIGKAMP